MENKKRGGKLNPGKGGWQRSQRQDQRSEGGPSRDEERGLPHHGPRQQVPQGRLSNPQQGPPGFQPREPPQHPHYQPSGPPFHGQLHFGGPRVRGPFPQRDTSAAGWQRPQRQSEGGLPHHGTRQQVPQGWLSNPQQGPSDFQPRGPPQHPHYQSSGPPLFRGRPHFGGPRVRGPFPQRNASVAFPQFPQHEAPSSRARWEQSGDMEATAPKPSQSFQAMTLHDAPVQQPAQETSSGTGGGKKKKGKRGGVSGSVVGAQVPKQSLASGDPQLSEPTPATSVAGGDDEREKKGVTTPVQGTTMTMKELTTSSLKIPTRPGGQNIVHSDTIFAKKIILEVNYLPIKFRDINLKIFHYDVDFKIVRKKEGPKDSKAGAQPDKPQRLPKNLLRPALRNLLDVYVPRRFPAFDGKKNMYAGGRKLEFPNESLLRDNVTIFDPERQIDVDFDITIKLVEQDLSLSRLYEYISSGSTLNMPQEVIQGVDIAMRNAPSTNPRLVSAGRSFFPIPANPPYLTEGMELWQGHYQSAIMAWKPYLNVDVANKAFPKAQPVLEFIRRDLNQDIKRPERDLRQPLNRYDENGLMSYLRGLKIEYRMPSNDAQGYRKRIYTVLGLGPPANRCTLTDEDRNNTVERYFKEEKKYPLQYPHLPTIQVPPATRNIFLPIELCHIAPNQVVMRKLNESQTSAMVRNAAVSTDQRKRLIENSIKTANFGRDRCMEEFGITIDTNFEKVEAYVMKSPTIRYKNTNVPVTNGVWQARNDQFIESPGLRNWVIINTHFHTKEHSIRKLIDDLTAAGRKVGIRVEEPRTEHMGNLRNDADYARAFKGFANQNVQIFLVIMANKENYGTIKRAAELNVGALTQCLKAEVCNRKMSTITAGNLLLKMNAKLGGVNHSLTQDSLPAILKDFDAAPVMLVGADVTHPPPNTEASSIAAVATSFDRYAFKYSMTYNLQRSSKESGRREMIDGLQGMMEKQLLLFYRQCGRKPVHILYYRDGVSEGEFSKVLDIELRAIRAACTKMENGYKPAITFIVVQKRHHTRFFPSAADCVKDWKGNLDRNRNVPAGTLVDGSITHPTEIDFFLVSHQSIQGTARPTKYHLLWDDYGFKQEDLEQLTYYLCHMFARCNRSVSYPAPTYYAHLAAFRAKAWWDGLRYNPCNLAQEQANKGVICDSIVNNAPMFFV